MADSCFLDAAIAEGFGLAEFVRRKFPGDNRLAMVRPKPTAPHKGYFPVSVACAFFSDARDPADVLADWKRVISGSRRKGCKVNKNQRFMQLLLNRLSKQQGRAVVADELIIASRGGAGGGGQSWVHPRLVSNFLNYACPEFAEEVNDIFTRFTTGDPALSAEAFENLKRVHAAELEAAHGDRLKEAAENVRFQALLKQHQDTNAALATEIAKLRLTEADLEKEVALANQAKIQAQEEAKMANEEAKIACEAKDKAEENIAVDSTRPGNIFAKMDSEDIPTSNRHSEPDLWFPARHITTDACIYFSRLNYRHFVNAVLVRKLPCEPHVSYAKSDFAKKLKSKNRKTRKAARKDIAARFKSLSTRKQLEIIDELVERTSDQFKDVFNCQLDIANCDLETATNNISMYATLCKSLKKGYGVDYSTEIETKYLAKMADNFNEFTGGACNMMLGQDYDQDFEDVDLIAC